MLLHAFEGEEHAERKAFRLHRQFARYFQATCSWGITSKDFNDTLAACLVSFYSRRLPVRIESKCKSKHMVDRLNPQPV